MPGWLAQSGKHPLAAPVIQVRFSMVVLMLLLQLKCATSIFLNNSELMTKPGPQYRIYTVSVEAKGMRSPNKLAL